ncbi:MAG: dihydroorotate dehydrogenase electron transfer subunit [Lachnospiraceae bacterium]|nr:dihydroorotate dehydrogenase electron transfer subunit [Lachnospiraceae bacterium]
MKIYEKAKVTKALELSKGIFELRIKTNIAKEAKPGQFVMVYPKDKSTILPRPISICEAEGDLLRLVYRVAGKGTKEFSLYEENEDVTVMGPIGNGFPIEKALGKKAVLIGGGIGVPPILQLSKEIKAKEVTTVLGYRNNDLFLKDDFDKYSNTVIATEDGSVGTKGNVLTAIKEQGIECDVIFACGPMPMLRAIKQYAKEKNIEAYISLEERMACGVGACLGCVCKTVKKDEHSHVNNARVCTEGPVFLASEVDI